MLTEKQQARHKRSLEGVHPDLLRIIDLASRKIAIDSDIAILAIEGLRTAKHQRELFAQGATTTLNSRHLDGHAADIVPVVGGQIRWDWPLFYVIEKAMKDAATELDLSDALEWGGDWRKFKDGPHWQLSRKTHPSPKSGRPE